MPIRGIKYDKIFQVSTISKIEIYASKTVALLTRGAARDLFDINYMINHHLISKNEINLYKKCFIFYWAIGNDYPLPNVDYVTIDAITTHKIFTDLVPVLRGQEKIDLNGIKKDVKEFLNNNLNFNDEELQFISKYNNKEYCPKLLFTNEILKRIKEHPMVMWKIRN